MPYRISPPRDSRPVRVRTLALGAVAAIALSAAVIATSRYGLQHAEWVAVDHVPPDACVAFYGPGPCREHGITIIGSTDAIAGPAPGEWQGKVQRLSPGEVRP